MKINKKTIIILIVVVVAAYLLWKKVKENGTGTNSQGTEPVANTTADKTSLSYILSHITFTSEERAMIESKRQACEASETTRQKYLEEAARKGYSLDQMIVLKAIWVLYNPSNNAWIDGPDGSSDYGWKLQQKVLQLAGQSLW